MTSEGLAQASRERRNRWLLSAPALIIVSLAACAPLLVIVVFSFLQAGSNGGVVWHPSSDGWLKILFNRDIFDDSLSLSSANVTILGRSLALSAITTVTCLLLGFPTAYFVATRPPAHRDVWLLLITVPFWTNLLIRTFAILDIIRRDGIINTLLLKLGLVEQPIQILFTDFAIVLGMTYVYLPLMILPVYASLERMDVRLLEAGSDLYARPVKVLSKIVLPLCAPGITAGCILVFIPAIGTYVTPVMLGGGRNLMIGNFIDLQFGSAKDWPFGSALSLVLMAFVMIALVIYVRSADTGGHEHG